MRLKESVQVRGRVCGERESVRVRTCASESVQVRECASERVCE